MPSIARLAGFDPEAVSKYVGVWRYTTMCPVGVRLTHTVRSPTRPADWLGAFNVAGCQLADSGIWLAKIDVFVLDDFGLARMTDEQSGDMLEVIEDRCERRPVIIASQLPVDNWHSAIPSATIADAIMDRIVHGAYRLELKGGTLRDKKYREKTKAPATVPSNTETQ